MREGLRLYSLLLFEDNSKHSHSQMLCLVFLILQQGQVSIKEYSRHLAAFLSFCHTSSLLFIQKASTSFTHEYSQ